MRGGYQGTVVELCAKQLTSHAATGPFAGAAYCTLDFGLFAIYPHRRYLAKKVRCFIDFLTDRFAEHASG